MSFPATDAGLYNDKGKKKKRLMFVLRFPYSPIFCILLYTDYL